jgi:hypothetical protein
MQMATLSTGDVSPGEGRDDDRKDLPMTQVDEEEVAKHSGTGTEAPDGEGSGIGGEPTPTT